MEVQLSSIGVVKCDVKDKKDIGWGSNVSNIVINDNFKDGLIGLSDFSHIIVVYFLHEAHFKYEKDLVRKPQGREDMPMVGILSQRAKDRPNPIGITSVELVSLNDNVITVKGLDAIDGTPILDIKPYYPMYDKKDNVIIPEWVTRLMKSYF